ncbi:MFS transporter, partial [Streptomyces sp. NPDC057927]
VRAPSMLRLAAASLAAAGLWLRSSLAESPSFLEMEDHARVPLAEVVRDHWRLVLLTAGGLAVGYAVFYAVTTWSLAYGVERLGVSRTVMLSCIMAAVVVQGSLTPVVALLGDRYGRRPLCLAGCTASALWMFPMIALLSTGEPLLMFLGFLVALLAFITMFAVIAAYLPELYEPRVRCTGAAVGYNLGGVLGGALTPIVATAVAEGERVPWGVAAYLTGIALFSLGCFALLPETRPVPRMAVAPATE